MNANGLARLVAALAVTTWSCAGHVTETSLAPGARVRVAAPAIEHGWGVGTLAALEADTIVVEIDAIHSPNRGSQPWHGPDALALALSDVKRLEVQRSQKSRAGTGVLIGATAGAAAGAIGFAIGQGTLLKECSTGSGCGLPGDAVIALAFIGGGAVVGAGIGALIGSQSEGDHWEKVPLGDIRVTPSLVTPDGLAISVSARF